MCAERRPSPLHFAAMSAGSSSWLTCAAPLAEPPARPWSVTAATPGPRTSENANRILRPAMRRTPLPSAEPPPHDIDPLARAKYRDRASSSSLTTPRAPVSVPEHVPSARAVAAPGCGRLVIGGDCVSTPVSSQLPSKVIGPCLLPASAVPTAQLYATHGRLLRALAEASSEDHEAKRAWREFLDPVIEAHSAKIADEIERGRISGIEAEPTVRALIGMNLQYFFDELVDSPDPNPEAAAPLLALWERALYYRPRSWA